MNSKVTNYDSGLGLLEIVAGIGIILTLSALAFPRIGRYWQLYALDSATQMLSLTTTGTPASANLSPAAIRVRTSSAARRACSAGGDRKSTRLNSSH